MIGQVLHGAYRVAGLLGQHGELSIGPVGIAVKNGDAAPDTVSIAIGFPMRFLLLSG
jgi:hypothetical protein